MQNFYSSSQPMPLDQADGLRRLFAGRRSHLLTLAANPHVPFGGLALDRMCSALTAQGHQVLVVDAASTSPLPHELALVDLSACVERIAPRAHYLPARGLAMHYVDTRGAAGGFIQAVQQAAPQADVVLLHADGQDLARLLKNRSSEQIMRPVLLGADHPESIKHAYANAKLLAQRCGLLSFDLLMVAAPHSPRITSISHSLADCIEQFLDGVLRSTAVVDPATDISAAAATDLLRLLAAQLHHKADEPESFAPTRARFEAPRATQVAWVPPSKAARFSSPTASRFAF
jgi:hypothetical protein